MATFKNALTQVLPSTGPAKGPVGKPTARFKPANVPAAKGAQKKSRC